LKSITMELPEELYLRLQYTAQATKQSLEEILLRAVQAGSPPSWETAPAEFQADLAALDHLDDSALWGIARFRQAQGEMDRYQELLDKNANGTISTPEREELAQLRAEADRHMLRKAYAAGLLQWRGHHLPPPDQL
jgi:hypothetical protein